MKPAKLLFKMTSRMRSLRCLKALNSIVDNLEDDENYFIQCTFDESDFSYNNPKFLDKINKFKNISYYFGENKTKISAINKDIDKFPPFDILINFSDDMVYLVKGFDNIIRQAFIDNFPDGDGWLHFHDSCQNRLSTMSVMDKKYFDRSGYIYHPDFISVYCDNFEQDLAKALGRYKYMGDDLKIFVHEHPLHGHKQYMDLQYRHTESFYPPDRATYLRLKSEFGI